ncbi:Spc97/Spc98 family protein, partial [archaeon]
SLPSFRSTYPYPPSAATPPPAPQSSTPVPTLKTVKLVMDMDSADRSIALKISSLFPMCECMLHIRGFVSRQTRYEYGLCSHALVNELQVILKDFYVLVAQLEYLLNQNKLTLQKFVYLLYPSSKVLYVLDMLCKEVSEKVGGELVNSLYALYLHQGDPESKVLYQRLLEKAVVPYIHIISSWIFRGELVDNYHEFLLVEDRTIDKEALLEDYNASYWDNKYTLQPRHVVTFLQSYANKILICGKYLHIVRDCLGDALMLSDMQPSVTSGGKKLLLLSDSSANAEEDVKVSEILELPTEQEISLDLANHHASIMSAVEYAYSISSRTLLSILIHKYSLYKHLASLHKYFLLKQGDFFIQFMDISETELKKDVKEIRLNKLQSLLYMAIQSSTLMHDNHKEKLTCTLASHNLIQHLHLIQIAGEYPGNAFSSAGMDNMYTNTMAGLKGIEAFTLDYLVTFPLSIVLSRRVITKYQLLSRLLYFSKHVERRVLSCWMFQQSTRDCVHVRGVMGAAYTLRHRMLHFMQNFVYYITFEVINPHEHQLTEDLKQANDMDQVMELHEKFLDICLKECLLASQDLLKVLTKLMTTCLLFGDHMTRFMTEATAAADSSQELTIPQPERPVSTRLNRQSNSFRKSPVHNSSNRDLKDFNDKDDAKEVALQKVALKLDSIISRRKQRIEKKTDFIAREAGHEAFVRIMNKFSETFDSQVMN